MIISEDVNTHTPLVIIFSDYNLLSRNIADQLKGKNYEVVVVTTDSDNWQQHEKKNFKIMTPDFLWNDLYEDVDNITLFLFDKNDIDDYLNSCEILSEKSRAKTLVVTTYSKKNEFHNYFKERVSQFLSNKNIFAGTLYLSDIFERSGVYKKIVNSTVDNVLTLDPKENFFLIKRETAEEQIIKNLLSLSIYGSSLSVTSLPISSKTLFKAILKYNPDLKVEYKKVDQKINESSEDKEIIEFNIDEEVRKLIGKGRVSLSPQKEWGNIPQISTSNSKDLVANESESQKKARQTFQMKNEIDITISRDKEDNFRMNLYESIKQTVSLRKKKHRLRKILLIAASFLFFPYFVFLVSVLGNKFGDLVNTSGQTNLAVNSYRFSKDTSFISQEYTRYMSNIPLLGIPYERSLKYVVLLQRDSSVSFDSLVLLRDTSRLFEQSFNKKIDNLPEKTKPIALSLDNVYKEYGLLKGEINSSTGISNQMMKIIVGKLPTDKEMRMISYYRESLIALPVLLGADEPTEYAILLVDNRIKRPSGGVVEAIALVTFNKGNLTNIIFYDAFDLDSQLQGFASPPTPLSENSNINEYYLREALWSSHFPRAVEEVKWFLEKEVQKDVDGVVVFDMNMLSSILEMTGPVVIDEQKVQGAGLVPALRVGSQNPLNADSYFKEIFTVAVNRVIKMDENRLRTFFSMLVDQLNSKHALLHIDYLSARINSSIFSSSMQGQDCNFDNCNSDFVSVSEVEFSRGVAVNKQVDIKVSFEEGVLKREVTVFYKNQRGLAREEGYKSNLLLSIPQETSVSPVTEIISNEQKETDPLLLGYDVFKQALSNVSVSPGQTKAYRFRWESGYDLNYSDEGQFRLRIIKQPGEEDYPMNITIEQPDDVLFYNERFDLTNDGTLHYNTQLSEDIDLIFNW